MPPSLFTTIHYAPMRQAPVAAAMRRLPLQLPPGASVYGVYEQRGTTPRDAGLQPHLHIVAMGVAEAPYRRLIRRLFGTLTRDIETQRLNPWRTADIVLRYLRGRKKDVAVGERETTKAWRRDIGVPMFIEVNFATRRAARGVTPAEYDKILKG